MKTISCALLAGILVFPQIAVAQTSGFVDVQESLDYRLIKLQRELAGLTERSETLGKKIEEVDKENGNAAAAVTEEDKSEKDTVAKALPEQKKTVATSSQSQPKSEVIPEEVPLPQPAVKKYNPQKTKDNKNSGRRPFIRSDISSEGQTVYYAGIAGREDFGFGDESNTDSGSDSGSDSSGGNYSGFNDKDVYVFPDAFAVNCELSANDAASNGKMSNCLESMIKDKAATNQGAKEHAIEVWNAGVYQETKEGVSAGVRNKNIAANFEAETLDPLNKKSSEATDERSDFETLTLTDMEAVKTKYRLIDVYASLLKFQALKNLSDYEIKSEEFTDIDAKSGASE